MILITLVIKKINQTCLALLVLNGHLSNYKPKVIAENDAFKPGPHEVS